MAAERGPSAVTVAAIARKLKARTGSFYHRFVSRDALLAELWLNTVLSFQEGIAAALDVGDGLRAELHTPAWVRDHLDEGRLLLLYHRDEFLHGDWPRGLRDRLAEQQRQGETRLRETRLAVLARMKVAGPCLCSQNCQWRRCASICCAVRSRQNLSTT